MSTTDMSSPLPEDTTPRHTPGPWHVEGELDKSILIVAPDPNPANYGMGRLDVEVNSDDRDTDIAMANARLIAAAPEMYDLLNDLHADLARYSKATEEVWSSGSIAFSSMADQIHEVLTKASGEATS